MRKKNHKYLWTILLFVITCCSCSKDNDEPSVNDFSIDDIQVYNLPDKLTNGTASPMTEGLDIELSSRVLITNQSEFKRAFKNYPNQSSIDFKKYRLLLLQISCPLPIQIEKDLYHKGNNKYDLVIKVKYDPKYPDYNYACAVGYILPKDYNPITGSSIMVHEQ